MNQQVTLIVPGYQGATIEIWGKNNNYRLTKSFPSLSLPTPLSWSSETIQQVGDQLQTPFALVLLNPVKTGIYKLELRRMVEALKTSNAALVYSHYYIQEETAIKPHPVIPYQEGSLRDDFHFGPMVLVSKEALCKYQPSGSYNFAGFYDWRLQIASRITYIPEYLYHCQFSQTSSSGLEQFEYVDPKNKALQKEMEQAATAFLSRTGALVSPPFKMVDFEIEKFPIPLSVIIPVKNRARTIEDAIKSVLHQRTSFPFNILVVDNHSNDGTTEILHNLAIKDPRVIHLTPGRLDLGIGGCWREAIHDDKCGAFAVQLDSDDIYKDTHTLQKIYQAFITKNCAMVIGSYQIVNFHLEELPPGLIDHREWTPENGPNNALRINGLGAPRAFYTPVLRDSHLPNVSYGEDYAAVLAICRKYEVGRIYDSLYLCRRWEENSDAQMDVEKENAHNLYKDRIRTLELQARREMNKKGKS